MRSTQRYAGESLRRVQAFLDTHADVVGTVNTTDARKQLDTAVSELDTTTTEQRARGHELQGELNHQRQLEAALRAQHMNPVTKFARAQLTGVPNFKALTPSVATLQGVQLVEASRAMVSAATPYVSLFTAAQFPADFLTQLTAAGDAVRSSINARASNKVQRVGATTQVATIVDSGRNAVATLDAPVSRLLVGKDRLLAEWQAAKRVALKPGGGSNVAPAAVEPVTAIAPAGTTVPVVAPEVAKAA